MSSESLDNEQLHYSSLCPKIELESIVNRQPYRNMDYEPLDFSYYNNRRK